MKSILILVLFAICVVLAFAQPQQKLQVGNVVYNYAKSYEKSKPEAHNLKKRGNGTNMCSTTLGDGSYTTIGSCATLKTIGQGLPLDGCYVITAGFACPSLTTIQGVFTGTLYGASRIITGLVNPLFSEIGVGGFVSDLSLDEVVISESSFGFVGSLARIARGAFISKVFIVGTGSVSSSMANAWIGGVVGDAREGTIMKQVSIESGMTVSGTGANAKVGGIAGGLRVFSLINITTASADVTTVQSGIAGTVVAVIDSDSSVINAVADASATADNTNMMKRKMKKSIAKRNTMPGAGGISGNVCGNSNIMTSFSDATIQANQNGGRVAGHVCDPGSSSISGTFFGQSSDFNLNGGAVPDTMMNDPQGATPLDTSNYDPQQLIDAGFDPSIFDLSGNQPPSFQSSATGGAVNDPHFYPLWKSNPRNLRYTVFSGIKGAVYNIITHPEIQWNAKFDSYKHLPYNWAHPEYIVDAAFIIKHPAGKNDARIEIRPAKYQGTSFFTGNIEVLVNGVAIEQGVRHHYFGNEHDDYYVYPYTTRHVYMASSSLKLKYHLQFITDNFLHDPKRMEQALEGRPTARWPLLNNIIASFSELEAAHGLLGQTARTTSPYKAPHEDCFSCFVEGKVSDYRLRHDNLFGTHFKYNKFNPID